MDHFDTLKELGFGSRLKRLGEQLISEVTQVYEQNEISFEPKWFPLFSLLLEHGALPVTEAARRLGLSHPHIILLAKEMEKAKLLTSSFAKEDRRQRKLSLTKSGASMGRTLQPLWNDVLCAVEELITEVDPHILNTLRTFEASLKQESLSERVTRKVNQRFLSEVSFEEYKPLWKKDFESLNLEWLSQVFDIERDLEEVDLRYFANPEAEIIKKGGAILFALYRRKPIATCALIATEDGLELAKMSVAEAYRGRGVGEALARTAIAKAKERGEQKLLLVTHTRLSAALQLYKKIGFKISHQGPNPKYKRANLVMTLDL